MLFLLRFDFQLKQCYVKRCDSQPFTNLRCSFHHRTYDGFFYAVIVNAYY